MTGETNSELELLLRPSTTLIDAVLSGDVARVKSLLDAGADIDEGSEHFVTPLCAAAAKNNLEIAKLLLERGCNIHKLSDGRPMYTTTTPLHYAILGGNIPMLRLLLDQGHNPNHASNYKSYPLIEAIEHNCPMIVDLLLKTGTCLVNELENSRMSSQVLHPPLYHALFNFKRYGIAKQLLDSRRCHLYFRGDSYLSILLCRAFDTNQMVLKSARILLQAGCDLECRDRYGQQPFTTLLKANHAIFRISPVKLLIVLLVQAGLLPCIENVNKIRSYAQDENEEKFCDWLHSVASSPASLSDQCRKFIRIHFGSYPNYHIKNLPLPPQILSYLTHESL